MFKVQIVHISYSILYDGMSDRVAFPGVLGEFEIADQHAPMVSLLGSGRISVKLPPDEREQDGERYDAKRIVIEQGLMRFDGKELVAIVE